MFKRKDYRHIICVVITLGILSLGLLNLSFIGRIIDGFRDLGLSIAYYFCEVYEIPHNIVPTVNNIPQALGKLPAPQIMFSVPQSFEEFKARITLFFELFFNAECFLSYIDSFIYILQFISLLFLPALLLAIVIRMVIANYLLRHNTGKVVETKNLIAFKRLSDKTYRPIKAWIKDFIEFVKENSTYYKIWLFSLALYFNFITIIIECFAYFFYFFAAFDFINLYLQFYKIG